MLSLLLFNMVERRWFSHYDRVIHWSINKETERFIGRTRDRVDLNEFPDRTRSLTSSYD